MLIDLPGSRCHPRIRKVSAFNTLNYILLELGAKGAMTTVAPPCRELSTNDW